MPRVPLIGEKKSLTKLLLLENAKCFVQEKSRRKFYQCLGEQKKVTQQKKVQSGADEFVVGGETKKTERK